MVLERSGMDYTEFLDSKRQRVADSGIAVMPEAVNPKLFDWQQQIVLWGLRKGQSAIFADCGLGKTPMQLEWAQKVSHNQDKPVLILAPLAVAPQTVREGQKFGIEVTRTSGEEKGQILITNYEKLHHFNPADFSGVVCDESSILKSFDGVRRSDITEFNAAHRLFNPLWSDNENLEIYGKCSNKYGHGHNYLLEITIRGFVNNNTNILTIER